MAIKYGDKLLFCFFVAIMILLLKKEEVFNFYSFQNKILMPHIFSLFQETEGRVRPKGF